LKLVIPAGAQFIGEPPIYRPGKRIARLLADKSAMGAINRPLQFYRFRLLMFIIAGEGEKAQYV
jgi:hypothetical protein